jgi:hypothetical protein
MEISASTNQLYELITPFKVEMACDLDIQNEIQEV